MPSSKDDREKPAVESPTRLDRPAVQPLPKLHEEDSSDETEVFIKRARRESVTKVAAARPPEPSLATIREAAPPHGGAASGPTPRAPAEPSAPVSKPALGQSVNVARAPLDDQGHGARYAPQGVLGE